MQGKYLTSFQQKLLLDTLEKDGLFNKYRQRIGIILLADAGMSQAQICMDLSCPQEMASYWILMTKAGQAHRWKEYTKGKYLTSFQHKLLLDALEKDVLSDEYRKRIEIMLLVDAGISQAQICTALGCAQEMARYWGMAPILAKKVCRGLERFNTKGFSVSSLAILLSSIAPRVD